MRKIVTSLMILAGFAANAQTLTVPVTDSQAKPVEGATVLLLRGKDSSVAKMGVTDKSGFYMFRNVVTGTYLVSVRSVGADILYGKSFSFTGDLKLPVIQLSQSADLKGITVSSKKPLIEVRADKTVINVENSINATGNDAFELLQKSPGVLADKDENLSMAGKNGVQVYIDGKPSPLSGKDLADYLHSIQSSQIESIELITNPSAKYEAAGNAGIINIRLKKNKTLGTNGSAYAGYNIGEMPKYNAGVNLNYRNKKINIFGNYNFNKNSQVGQQNISRVLLDTLFDGSNGRFGKNQFNGFKAGVDYYADKRNTFGVMVSGNYGNNQIDFSGATPITYLPTNTLNRTLVAQNHVMGNRNNLNNNLNYRYTDTSGHEFNLDGDYGLFRLRNNQYQPNTYYSPSGSMLNQYIYNMISPTDIDIYSVKGDYEQNFAKGRLGLGGKVSFVNSDNDFQRYNVNPPSKVLDTLRSNRFVYKENINAVYANYNRAFKGFIIQAGLRVENTQAKASSLGYRFDKGSYQPYDSGFNRSYTDLFPSAAITFNKNPKSQWTLSYSRRIDRPAYQDLNPFEFKLDEYTYQRGNTNLRPQYTNAFTLTNVFKNKLTTALSYSHVDDVFTQLIDTAERSKAFISKQNLAKENLVNLNISLPLQIKWYSVYINANTNYSHYTADLGPGRHVDLDAVSFNFYAQNTFKLSKTFTAELSGFYNAPSIDQGTFRSRSMYSVDAGLQATVLKGKGTIKTAVTDIFHTQRFYGVSDFAGQHLEVLSTWESRQLRVSFTYRFGSNQVKAARQHKTSAEEESQRASGGGGGK